MRQRAQSNLILISSLFMVTWSSSWDNIPQIPANRRAQFHLSDKNGDYRYGYDTGDGSSARQKSQNHRVEGAYSYIDDQKRLVEVSYVAGADGFIPEIRIDGRLDPRFRKMEKPELKSVSHAAAIDRQLSSINRGSKRFVADEMDQRELSSPIIDTAATTTVERRQNNSDNVSNIPSLKESSGETAGNIRQLVDDELSGGLVDQQKTPIKIESTSTPTDLFRESSEANVDDQGEELTTESNQLQFPNDQRFVNQAKHLHPSYTIITPDDARQRSFEYGVRNAVILGFLPPKHEERVGYIYDTL